MKSKWILRSVLAALLLSLLGLTVGQADPWADSQTQGAAAPTVVSYQGQVQVSGVPFNGNGYFKFAVVNAAGNLTYWSNDDTSSGGSEPTSAVQLPVNNGIFIVLLGDTSLGGMTQQLTAAVFSGYDRYLRVWFRAGTSGAFTRLTPDTRIAAVPYALQAQHAASPGNVIAVAKSNGDFTSIQMAIDSITNAGAGNLYLIWIAPGWYNEAVTLKPYIHLQGAGQGVTYIQAEASNGAVLTLANNTNVSDLSISNIGTGPQNYGIYGDDVTNVEMADVYAEAGGSGTSNIAIALTGVDTEVTLDNVTAMAGKASGSNTGLSITLGPEVTLHGGMFNGTGGANAYGIWLAGGSDTFLGAADVHATAADANANNVGLSNSNYPTVLLQGGFFMGSGGQQATGIDNFNGARLEAEGVTAQGESGATSASAKALFNHADGQTSLRGGSFTARAAGGTYAWAIHNIGGANTILEAHDVTAVAEGGTVNNQGLRNEQIDTVARVYRGSFTGRGGNLTTGVNNVGDLTLQAVSALGENGGQNYGLYTVADTVRADCCRFKGNTAAVYQGSGTLYLAVSQLDGGLSQAGGSRTCFEVYNANYVLYTCP